MDIITSFNCVCPFHIELIIEDQLISIRISIKIIDQLLYEIVLEIVLMINC